jgi:TOTE conflict system, Archaeo-Eukaryotic Primase domain
MGEATGALSTADEIARLRAELASVKAENSRLHRVLGITDRSVVPDDPSQDALFVGNQGPVDAHSSAQRKIALYRTLFAGRDDAHAVRWENTRTGKAGWVPAVQGGWRKNGPRNYPQVSPGPPWWPGKFSGSNHRATTVELGSSIHRMVIQGGSRRIAGAVSG